MRSLLSIVYLNAVVASVTWAATLTGTAGDTTGHAIPNALIVVLSARSGREVAWSHTDASGAYLFSSLPTGDFSIAISLPGFIVTTVRDFRLNDG